MNYFKLENTKKLTHWNCFFICVGVYFVSFIVEVLVSFFLRVYVCTMKIYFLFLFFFFPEKQLILVFDIFIHKTLIKTSQLHFSTHSRIGARWMHFSDHACDWSSPVAAAVLTSAHRKIVLDQKLPHRHGLPHNCSTSRSDTNRIQKDFLELQMNRQPESKTKTTTSIFWLP